MPDKTRIPVTILNGFLGSGKTTLLNAILTEPAFRDTAVIVNEFGDVSIDHDLVTVGKREMMVTKTGCICCTVRSDLRSSLVELLEASRAGAAPNFSRVVVELTGLADPAPAINQVVPGGMAANALRDHAVGRSMRPAFGSPASAPRSLAIGRSANAPRRHHARHCA